MGNPKCGTTKSLQEKDPSASSNKEITVCKCVYELDFHHYVV